MTNKLTMYQISFRLSPKAITQGYKGTLWYENFRGVLRDDKFCTNPCQETLSMFSPRMTPLNISLLCDRAYV